MCRTLRTHKRRRFPHMLQRSHGQQTRARNRPQNRCSPAKPPIRPMARCQRSAHRRDPKRSRWKPSPVRLPALQGHKESSSLQQRNASDRHHQRHGSLLQRLRYRLSSLNSGFPFMILKKMKLYLKEKICFKKIKSF